MSSPFAFSHPAAHPLTTPASLSHLCKMAVLDWQILEAPATYAPPALPPEPVMAVDDAKVLYRSDTLQALAVVPSRFNPTQPDEVLDYYLRFSEFYAQPLVSAGCLQSGKLLWGLIRTGNHRLIRENENAWSHLLLSTRCDSPIAATLTGLCILERGGTTLPASFATHAPFALAHSSEFLTPDALLGVATCGAETEQFLEALKDLATAQLNMTPAKYLSAVFETGTSSPRAPRSKAPQKILAALAAPGRTRPPTALDLVIAVAEHVDHGASRHSAYDRLHSAWFGAGAARKQLAFTLAFNSLR
ncbi:MAG: hypothetical protein JWQ07_4462 [Ramlibacter sp.]|nr:hypothetical protein [Ramlibacter sp.]